MMAKPSSVLKILTLSNYYPEHVGGIEFVALNMVKRWRKHHQVRWIACDVKAHAHRCDQDDVPLEASNFTEDRLGFPYPIPLGRSALQIFEQVKWCDVVHLHDCLYLPNWIAFLAARWHRKPLLVTQHAALAAYPETYKRTLQWLAYRIPGCTILKNADRVAFISLRVKHWFESWMRFKHQTLLLPNGVDHQLFFPPTPAERRTYRSRIGLIRNESIALFIGRFVQNKGVHLVHEMAQARPDIHWLLLGNGEIDPRDWNLPNIHVTPPQPQLELRQYYIAADLFVLPSVGEGFPLAVQEALACGLPAAVSEETAAYLPDAPLLRLDIAALPAMLQTLDNVFSDNERLSALRRESAEYARRWDWDNVAAEYEQLFSQLICPSDAA